MNVFSFFEIFTEDLVFEPFDFDLIFCFRGFRRFYRLSFFRSWSLFFSIATGNKKQKNKT